MDYILDFQNVDRNSLSSVGGKNASLGEMIKAGIRVPPGFAVTTDSYLRFISEAGLKDKIYGLLSGLNPENTSQLLEASEEIQSMMGRQEFPGEIRKAISDHYRRLCDWFAARIMPVAVRSSATAEDLPTASFAGQQDTYLWIQGEEEVAGKVKKCWSSLFNPRAVSYRIKNRFPHEKVLISVGVQKMVNAKAAGVMFTINPTDGDPSKAVIEASWGLGETVVSGSVNPDKFVVDKVILEIGERRISEKHIACLFDEEKGEVVNCEVDPEIRGKCCLEDREVKMLVQMGNEIERHYGRPMDIEWAIDKGLPFPHNIFIVQARPETVWSQKKKEPLLGKKSGYELLMERAMKRIRIP
ncbi:MAG: phenylphosphate synthase subunit beta [Desulfobacteraceae bacterium]|jgi:pyruvate,water dikinase|nr:MAG: phenylphosphate synthase subunit beta [Desulfobacteraceae bacterium]